MPEYILRAMDIEKHFVGVKALNKVHIEIRKGEIHCLAGENGSGKSTLIKVISGVHKSDGGVLEICGKQVSQLTPKEAMHSGIQVIYQDFSIFHGLTVKENIVFYYQTATGAKWVNWKMVRDKAMETMALIGLHLDPDELVENLSVADKQMIAIARALVNDAKLIIMDEPTTALTHREVQNLFSVIKGLQERGIAILFVSHKIDEVFSISERFTILRNGENVVTGDTSELNHENFTYYMTGRQFERDSYVRDVTDNAVAMEVRNLSLKNGFEDISFQVRKGEILGIVGLLGSGRTELALSLFGIRPADKGSITVNGKAHAIRSVKAAMAAGIGYLPEDRLTEGLFLLRSIANNIIVSELDGLTKGPGILDEKQCTAEVERWGKELAIATPDYGNAVQTLSGGNQQRVVLAKWLARDMDVLILNGPTVGVDIGSKHDIYHILEKLAAQDKAIIVISDDLPEVMMLCNHVMVMKDGRFIGDFDIGNVTAEKIAVMVAGAEKYDAMEG